MEFNIQPQVIVVCGLIFVVTFLRRIFSIHARSNNSKSAPPEPARAWPFIGHLHLLGANKLLHHLFGAMADEHGPIFSLQLGIHKALVVSSWEVARECFTVQDKVFSTRPKSLAVKIMGYDQALFGFLPYGPQWRDLRKLVMIEILSTHRLDMLKHVRESEVNLFIRGLFEIWISKGDGSMPVVELKERFGDLTTNIVVRMVAGKRYFGTGVYKNEESRRFQKSMGDFMHLVGLFMVSDAVPLLGWIDSLRGYRGKMKKTAKEIDQVLGSWMNEHRQKRELSRNDELEQDFMHVMLSVMESDRSSQITDTTIKSTCLVSPLRSNTYTCSGTSNFYSTPKDNFKTCACIVVKGRNLPIVEFCNQCSEHFKLGILLKDNIYKGYLTCLKDKSIGMTVCSRILKTV